MKEEVKKGIIFTGGAGLYLEAVQVIGKRTVILRPISETVTRQDRGAIETVKPLPGQYVGKLEMKKRVMEDENGLYVTYYGGRRLYIWSGQTASRWVNA